MSESSSESSTPVADCERKYCPNCYQQFEGPISACPDDQTPLRGANNDPLIGRVFADRYEIQSVLGFGGMSIVYKAKHRLMDRIVAIKMLHSKLKEDITALERFKLEAQAASSLNHQNIISVYDFGVTPEGEPFFVMDCLEGESLRELIDRKGKVPFERALPIFRQICEGLDAAHKKLIIHRDLKPANVVLIKQDDGSEIVKLVDFGIAKLLPGSGKALQHLTQTGEVFGSPIYMSPEQCLGKELDTRSDIYALGCLMYETLAGDPPFVGDSFLETMNKHVGEEPKPINVTAPDAKVPPELEQVIFRALLKNPDHRFQTAGEIRDAISAITVALLGSTGRQRAFISGVTPPTFPPAKKQPALLVVCAVLIFALAGTFAFIAFWPGAPEDRGTPLDKLTWLVSISNATNAIKSGDFAGADRNLSHAESLARKFGDRKTKLEATLRTQADLYDKWEGHAEQLEKVNAEITEIQIKRIREEFLERLDLIAALNRPTQSGVLQVNAKLRAEAQIPGILSTASKLYGRGLYDDGKALLTKALAVETRLLGSDSVSLAQLQTKLADVLVQLREFPSVRPLLLEACRLAKQNREAEPAEYVRILNKLGQFDLDQSNFTDAERELGQAAREALKLKRSKDLTLICMRSYADFLRQTKQVDESKKLLHEADVLEKDSN